MLTEDAIFINNEFYLMLKKKSQKDYMYKFEKTRDKIIFKDPKKDIFNIGPFISCDKQNLIYISTLI